MLHWTLEPHVHVQTIAGKEAGGTVDSGTLGQFETA